MEALVAVMLLSICLVVILQLFSSGLKAGDLTERYTRGIFHAQNLMEKTLLRKEFEEGVSEGIIDDAFSFRIEIHRILAEDEKHSDWDRDLFDISVTTIWQDAKGLKDFKISTVAMGTDMMTEH